MRRSLLDAASAQIDASQLPVIQAISAVGGELLYRYQVVNALAVRLPETALVELEARPDIAKIHEDGQIFAQLDVSAVAAGAQSWWAADHSGGPWDVAIIDTGLDPAHPAFDDHTIVEVRFLDAAGDQAIHDPLPDDVNGHGTHVAGIVSSNDTYYRGIAFGHDKMFNLKAGYDPDGADGGVAYMLWSDAMAAVNWALNTDLLDEPEVLNLSFGACAHPSPSQGELGFTRFWDAVVDDFNVSVAISAGNDGNTCIHYPSIAYNVLSVANVDDRGTVDRSDDGISASSSQGPAPDGRRKPDLAAPGTVIYSANNTWEDSYDWTGYSGTSQAAPHIAGALLLARDGGLYYPQAQKAFLINSAQDRDSAGWDASWGWGYLDLSAAYNSLANVETGLLIPAPDYDLFRASFSSGDRATLVWNRHVDYADATYPTITDTHELSDIDLYLYDEFTNAQVDASVLTGDNVEQVTADNSYTGILRVQAVSPSFDGVYQERYAIAAPDGLTAVDGPELSTIAERTFHGIAGRTVQATIPAINSGDLTLHAVSATASWPPEVSWVKGANPAALGNIPTGESRNATWVFTIPEGTTHTITIDLAGIGYGLAYSTQTTAILADFVPVGFAYLPLISQ